jgi:hypothetical protein
MSYLIKESFPQLLGKQNSIQLQMKFTLITSLTKSLQKYYCDHLEEQANLLLVGFCLDI